MEQKETVLKIQQFIFSSDQTDKPDNWELGNKYSASCAELNNRLEQCKSLMSKGKNIEAVNLAEEEPSILELFDILNFSELSDWNDFCSLYDYPQAPELRSDLLKLIKGAYEENSILQPLIRKYSKLVHRGSIAERIALLRKIWSLDNANPRWKNDLIGLEQQRFEEIKKDAQVAIKNDDIASLKNLYSEILSCDWNMELEQTVVSRIEEEVNKKHLENLEQKSLKILTEVGDAYSLFDMKALKVGLVKWNNLLKDEAFVPDDSELMQINESKEWVDEEELKLLQEEEYNQQVDEFKLALENKKDLEKISNLYFKLKESNNELSDILETQYKQVKEEFETTEVRAYKQRIILTVAACLIVAGGLFGFVKYRQIQKEYMQWCIVIEESIENNSLDKGLKLFDKLAVEKKEFVNKPEILSLKSKLNKLLSERKARRARYAELIATLQDLHKSQYQSDINWQELHDEALSLAENQDNKNTLQNLKIQKDEWEISSQKQRDLAFQTRSKEQELHFEKIIKLNPEDNRVDFYNQKELFKTNLSKLKAVQNITTEFYKNWTELLDSKLKILEDELDMADKNIKTREFALNKLYQDFYPFDMYKISLGSLIKKLGTDPKISWYKFIYDNFDFYKSVGDLQVLDAEKIEGEAINKYYDIANNHIKNNIWQDELEHFSNQQKAFLDETKKDIRKFKSFRNGGYADTYRLAYKDNSDKLQTQYIKNLEKEFIDDNNLIFICKILKKVDENETEADGVLWRKNGLWSLFEGEPRTGSLFNSDRGQKNKVLSWEDRGTPTYLYTNTKPVFSKVNFVNTPMLHINEKYRSHLYLLANKVMSILEEKNKIEQNLLNVYYEIKNKKMNPIYKILLIQNVLAILQKYSYSSSNIYQEQLDDVDIFVKFNKIKDIDHIFHNNEDELKIEQYIGKLSNIRPQIETNLFSEKFEKFSISRKLTYIGIVTDLSDKFLFRFKTAEYREIWVMLPNKDGSFSVHNIGFRRNKVNSIKKQRFGIINR